MEQFISRILSRSAVVPAALPMTLLMALLMALLMLPQALDAQVSAVSADHVDSLVFTSGHPEEPLFVFHQKTAKAGNLNARYPAGGPFSFEWRKYDPALPGYGAIFHSDAGVSTSQVTNLDGGGYQVRIFDGATVDTTLYAWVHLNEFEVEIEKDAMGEIPSYRYTCDYISIQGFVRPSTVLYYDPDTNQANEYPVAYKFKWTSDNDELQIPYDTVLLISTSFLPPYEDTEYYLTATDEYGYTDSDTAFYESIQTKAEFEVEYWDKINHEYSPDLTISWSDEEGSLDAPLTVRFNNISRNGTNYLWVLLDTTDHLVTEITHDTSEHVEYIYEAADKYYYPKIISQSAAGCIDSFSIAGGIQVVASQLNIPNVFSPNDDGNNDFWVFKHQSIKDFEVTITDRNGKVVYKYRKDPADIYAWEGWNGNMHNSGRPAPVGAYYFVIKALGYDGEEYRDPNIIEQWREGRSDNTTGGSGTGTGTGETVQQTLYTGWLYLFRDINPGFY